MCVHIRRRRRLRDDDSYEKRLVQMDVFRSRADDVDNSAPGGAVNAMYTNVQRRTHVREMVEDEDEFADTDTDLSKDTSRGTKPNDSESHSADSALFSAEELDLDLLDSTEDVDQVRGSCSYLYPLYFLTVQRIAQTLPRLPTLSL